MESPPLFVFDTVTKESLEGDPLYCPLDVGWIYIGVSKPTKETHAYQCGCIDSEFISEVRMRWHKWKLTDNGKSYTVYYLIGQCMHCKLIYWASS